MNSTRSLVIKGYSQGVPTPFLKGWQHVAYNFVIYIKWSRPGLITMMWMSCNSMWNIDLNGHLQLTRAPHQGHIKNMSSSYSMGFVCFSTWLCKAVIHKWRPANFNFFWSPPLSHSYVLCLIYLCHTTTNPSPPNCVMSFLNVPKDTICVTFIADTIL